MMRRHSGWTDFRKKSESSRTAELKVCASQRHGTRNCAYILAPRLIKYLMAYCTKAGLGKGSRICGRGTLQ